MSERQPRMLSLTDEEAAILVEAIDALLWTLRENLGDVMVDESVKHRDEAELKAKQIVALYAVRRRIAPPEVEPV